MLASIGTRTEATQKAPAFRRLAGPMMAGDLCLELTESVNENTALRSRAGFKRGIIASSHSDARRNLGKRDAGRVRDQQFTDSTFSRRSTIVEAKRFEVDYGKKPKPSLGDGRLDTPFTVSWLTMHVIQAQARLSVSFSMHGSHWQ